MLLTSARPGPIFRLGDQPRLHRIVFDVFLNADEFAFASNPMIERFVLPESLSSSTQDTITGLRSDALQCARDVTNAGKRGEQHVYMIRHHGVGMQIVASKFRRTSSENLDDGTCARRVLEPQRSLGRPVEQFFGEAELFARPYAGVQSQAAQKPCRQ